MRWGRFDELSDRNNYLLYLDLKKAADAPKTALQTKYGDYLRRVHECGPGRTSWARSRCEPQLDAIAAVRDKKQLAALDVEASKRF